jgi:5-methyltetrahydrofolate--homocysteine methyltransferase
MGDYNMEAYAYELNYAGARLAREACDVTAKDPTKPRFVVVPSVPLTECSISPSVEDPAARNVHFDLVETPGADCRSYGGAGS